MIELDDSVYEDSGLDAPDDSGGSSGGGGGGGWDGTDAAPGSDDFDDAAQDAVTDSMEDQGFVVDEDLTSGSGGGTTRSPDEGTDFTELGEDVHNSPEVEVDEPLGGRFVGDTFENLREYGTTLIDTSPAGERSAAAADAVARGQEIAGATFEALDPSTLDISELQPELPQPLRPSEDGGLTAALAAAAAVVVGIGAVAFGGDA